ncbi:MAG: hypothetical protein ACLFTY_03930 [Candidatus Aenigmatarchaeota archaeon]
MKLVIKIGGSISMNKNGPDHAYISRFLDVIDEFSEDHKISICVGGGDFVGSYSEAIEKFGLDDEERELCFIELMRANVMLLSILTGKEPLFDLSKYEGGEVVVSGIEPGRSTDANAAEVARIMDADLFVKLTDVDGIYDKDPAENKDAELIRSFDFEDIDTIGGEETPLDYGPLDPTALKIIKENRIETVLTDGRDLENLREAVEGERVGTRIG